MSKDAKLDVFDKDDASKKLAKLKLMADADQLKNILFELLGSAEVIERKYTASFEVNSEDLLSFNHLIEQKISEQNEVVLEAFSVSYLYEDGSSRTVSSKVGLMDYQQVNFSEIQGVHLRWGLLINITDKKSTHRQEIDLVFDKSRVLDNITLNIKHTTKLWGVEVDQLFDRQIKNLTNEVPKWLQLVRDKFSLSLIDIAGWSVLVPGAIFFFWMLISTSYEPVKEIYLLDRNQFSDRYLSGEIVYHSQEDSLLFGLIEMGIINYFDKKDLDSLAALNPSILREIENGLFVKGVLFESDRAKSIENLDRTDRFFDWSRRNKYKVLILYYLILLFVAFSYRALIIVFQNDSFILMTEKSYEDKKRTEKLRKRKFVKNAIGAFISLLIGVSGNWLYNFVF